MSIRVEMIGPPGSGKSTLVTALSRRRVGTSRARMVSADRLALVPRRSLGGLAGLLEHPLVIGALAGAPRLAHVVARSRLDESRPGGEHDDLRAFVRARRPTGPRGDDPYRSGALDWLDMTLVLVDVAERAPEGVVPLLAEGLAQRSLSVLGAGIRPEDRDVFLRMLAPPRLLVHLRASTGLLVARARGRLADGSTPVLHRGRRPDETVRFLEEDAVALDGTTRALADLGWPVLTLSVDGIDADGLADRVVDQLASDGRP